MPELSATQLIAFAAFASLVLVWLVAPNASVVAAPRELPAAA